MLLWVFLFKWGKIGMNSKWCVHVCSPVASLETAEREKVHVGWMWTAGRLCMTQWCWPSSRKRPAIRFPLSSVTKPAGCNESLLAAMMGFNSNGSSPVLETCQGQTSEQNGMLLRRSRRCSSCSPVSEDGGFDWTQQSGALVSQEEKQTFVKPMLQRNDWKFPV